jgi:hypothetical protein
MHPPILTELEPFRLGDAMPFDNPGWYVEIAGYDFASFQKSAAL